MGFFDTIGNIVTGGALGGIVGAVGAIGNKVVELKMEAAKRETLALQNAHELALRDKDREMAAQESASNLEIHKTDADSATAIADAGSLVASFQADRATYGESTLGRIVDFVRGLTRPGITMWAAALLGYITWKAITELGGAPLGPERSMELIQNSVFVSSLAISWWFASRPSERRGRSR
jgi:hypothetical protein